MPAPHLPDAINVPHARRQIAVDQQPGGINYPFILPSNDLGQLIADFYLQYRDDDEVFDPNLRIKALWNFGTTGAAGPAFVHEYDLLIHDAANHLVFDTKTATSFQVTEWGDDKRVIEWIKEDIAVCRAVIWKAWPPDATPITWPQYFEPADGRLDPRSYECRPRDVTTLIVDENDGSSKEIVAGKKVIFKPGYNYKLEPAPTQEIDGGALRNVIVLAVEPGAGAGKVPGCDEQVLAIHRINGVTGDEAGNVAVDVVGCYHNELVPADVQGPDPDEITVEESTVRIANDCKACYQCDQFALVYNALRRLYLRYKALGERAEAARDQLQLNIDRWESSRECRRGNILRTSALALGACRVGIGAAICNNSDVPLVGAKLEISIETTSESGMCLVRNSILRRGNVDPTSSVPPNQMQPYEPSGTFPDSIVAEFDCISPATMGTLVLQVEILDGRDDDTVTMLVKSTGGIVAVPKQQTIGLKCTAEDNPLYCDQALGTTTGTFFAAMAPNITNGDVARIVASPDGQAAMLLPYGAYSPGLQESDEVSISDTAGTSYTGKHRVAKVFSPRVLILDTKFDGEATGGHWLKV